MGKKGKREVKDDSQVFNLSDRAEEEGTFTEMTSIEGRAFLREQCEGSVGTSQRNVHSHYPVPKKADRL